MSAPASDEVFEWPIRSTANTIAHSLRTIISILDGVDKTHTHVALRDARDQMDQERARFIGLIICINNGRMDDKDVDNKLEHFAGAFILRASSLGEVAGDKDKLATAVAAFNTAITAQFKAIYETYPAPVVQYLDNLHKD